MSRSLKLYFGFFFIYLCQFVQSYNPRHQTICTQLVYNAGTGYTVLRYCCNGYTKDTSSRNFKCIPVCPTGCPNGSCKSPNVCTCDIGYTNNTATLSCEPSCFEPCINGDCVAPDICKCRPGFRELNATYCEPIPPLCSPSCFNGDCVGPSMCKCHDGYYKPTGWGDRNGFEYTCLPQTTTSTTTTTANTVIISTPIDDDEILENSSENTTETSSSSPEVTDHDQIFTDQLVTDQDTLHRAKYAEIITEPDFTTEDVNEVTASVSNVSDGSVTVLVLFGGFTELDNNSPKNENTTNGSNIWIYISSAMLLVAILILLLIAFRRRILGYIKGRTYVVQGEQTRSVSSRTFNVTFSSTSNEK